MPKTRAMFLAVTSKGVVQITTARLPSCSKEMPSCRLHVEQDPQSPRPVIKKSTSGATCVSVLAGAGELEFHYAALSYFAPRKVTFKRKLEGESFEDDWSTPSTPGLAHYTNMPPGRYTFRVKAANNDGVWNETGASFSFYLEPRFYQTRWFKSLCALVLVLSPIGVYLLRIRQVRIRERELVILVGRRTRELQVAKELAEAATRSKSEFLANMSHEIRTPLYGVTGMLELIDHSELTSEQKQMVVMAQDSANTLMAVINDVLDFSKIEAGKLAFDVREFELSDAVAEAARNMALRAHQKGLELAYQVDTAVPRFLMGDAHRIKQVLINLLSNAVKFTEKGEVILRVAEESRSQEEVHLRFSVSDTGIGIAAEKQRLIFEAFSQGDASTTRKYGGTGLGLTISSRIVELMGGKIVVDEAIQNGQKNFAGLIGRLTSAARPSHGARTRIGASNVTDFFAWRSVSVTRSRNSPGRFRVISATPELLRYCSAFWAM